MRTYTCAGSACLSNCDGNEDCASGYRCQSVDSVCTDLSFIGESCGGDAQCYSGQCVDGVCCESACEGECLACSQAKTGESNGLCRNVSLGSDPDSECRDDGAASCGLNGACGSGGCALYATGTECAPGDMYRRRPFWRTQGVMAVAHVPLLGTWPKTAALTPVTAQRVYRVAQPTLHVQAGSVVQQATVFVRISLSWARPAAVTVSVTPAPALTVFVVRAPVRVSVRLARQAKRGRLMEAVPRLLRGDPDNECATGCCVLWSDWRV